MIDYKLPVENVIGFTIGDIVVDVDIRFQPRSIPSDMERIAIDLFDSKMGQIAWECKQDIKKKIEEVLKGKEDNLKK